jgi:RNA polymerase sigma-70 factor (ECF subfamily)
VNPSDAEIVRQVRAGNVEAFGVLVERHHDALGRYALHLLGNRTDAEDVLQETFVRAFRAIHTYEERERFRPWLLRILVNRCRSAAARSTAALDVPLDPETLVWEPGENPLEVMALREELARALAQLPGEQREAVALRFGDELSFEEMSTITGAGISALKMRVRRGCDRLRALLEASRARP